MSTGEDQSQADQPNSLAEGPPVRQTQQPRYGALLALCLLQRPTSGSSVWRPGRLALMLGASLSGVLGCPGHNAATYAYVLASWQSSLYIVSCSNYDTSNCMNAF
eukprot:1140884-Pelagomonas_calceolata.AAC.1